MSSPTATPESTLSSTFPESQAEGPPSSACPSEISQPLPTNDSTNDQSKSQPAIEKINEPVYVPTEELKEEWQRSFARMLATNMVLQELWFEKMKRPIPGYPHIKPPPPKSVSILPKHSAADANKSRRFNPYRKGRNYVKLASTPPAPGSSKVKDPKDVPAWPFWRPTNA
ncbi:hypothetical protein M413DRAFT_31184 [Hebeloma cylindrosporum]|uniref:Uncharacterized protein n=1 Tax=Hebeloma cylindrosporum TaxID=76867 RepID=A0A0C3BZZ6_HEBCY|nr:hypothetical protein M413DRAFT_31184 [Hebeloma cylindrosporum h7]